MDRKTIEESFYKVLSQHYRAEEQKPLAEMVLESNIEENVEQLSIEDLL
jgi:hypothetical protein